MGEGIFKRHRRFVRAGIFHAVLVRRAAVCTAVTQTFGLIARGNVHLVLNAVAGLERRGGGKDLEHGTGAIAHHRVRLGQGGLILLGVEPVAAGGDHGEHVAVLRIRAQHVHDAGDPRGIGVDLARNVVLCLVLDLGIQGGLDGVAAALELVGVDALLIEVLHHVVAEEPAIAGADAAVGQSVRFVQNAELLARGGVGLFLRDVAVCRHCVQDRVAAVLGPVRVGVGIERLRGLHHAGEHRGFRDAELAGGLAKVRPRGGLHAERVVTEGDEV